MASRVPDFGSRRLYHRCFGSRSPADVIEHLLRLQELAEAARQDFEEFVEGPPVDVAYAARAVARIRRALGRGKASNRKSALQDLTRTLGHDGPARLRAVIVSGLRAYAMRHTASPGNPSKLRGAASNLGREIVNAAIDQLVSEELAKDFHEQRGLAWLFECGRPGCPSPGHALIMKRARELAVDAGKDVSERALSRQVTEATRAVRARSPGRWVLETAHNRLARRRRPC